MKTIEFKVAMDAEQARLKNYKTIKFEVDMSKVSRDTLETLACSAQTVRWQAEIRSHWDEKLPTTVEFGMPLFSKRPSATITEERAIEKVNSMTELKKVSLMIDMYRSMGQKVPEELLSRLDELEENE